MNTRKQVLLMSALLLVALLVVGIYGAWYPYREVDATEEFEEKTQERAAILFARNCRLCHGDVGEGGALGARLLAAPALDRPDLQGFIDSKATAAANVSSTATTVSVSSATGFKPKQTILIDEERMEVSKIDGTTLTVKRGTSHTEPAAHTSGASVQFLDTAALDEKVDLITNTITCGRVGTAMPAWAQTQGGPLSDEQIRQLMVLITTGSWELVKEEVDVEDRVASRLTAPVSDDTTSLNVSDVAVFTEKEAVRIGDERLRVTGVPKTTTENGKSVEIGKAKDKSGVISVERGVLGTTPFEHTEDEIIYRFPEVADPAINMASCGQTARPAAPAGDPAPIEPFEGQTVEVVAQGLAFDMKQITVSSGGQLRVRLDNKDTLDHNIAFYTSATNLTPVSPGSVGLVFKGPAVDDTAFAVPAKGSYFFRCDVHATTMTGTFTVN
jgi:plastocyanin